MGKGWLNVWYILMATFSLLLFLSVAFSEKIDTEPWLWAKLPLYLTTSFISFNISVVRIPILVFVVYLFIRKRQIPNKGSKQLALGFASVLFLLSNYAIPFISLNHLGLSRELYGAILRFQRVESVQVFSPTIALQQRLQDASEFHGAALTLGLFIAEQEQLDLAEQESQWYTQQQELIDVYGFDYYLKTVQGETYVTTLGSRKISKGYELHMSFRKLDRDYYAIFDTYNGERYLKYVISGKLRQSVWPVFPLSGGAGLFVGPTGI